MGRVTGFRYSAGVVLLALVAVLVLFARGSNVAEASSFSPVSTLNVADPTPGAASDVTASVLIPLGDSQFSSLDYVTFIPSAWSVATDAAIPDGSTMGNAFALAKLGALNAFCGIITLPAVVPFLDSTTGTWGTDPDGPGGPLLPPFLGPTVKFEDTDFDGRGEWFDSGFDFTSNPGTNALAIRAAVTRYPDNLAVLFPQPRARWFGYLNAAGTNVGVNLLFFNPGDLLAYGHTATKGYPVVLTIQRLGDPLSPGDPGSALTDFCSSFSSSVTFGSGAAFGPAASGLALCNPFTGCAPAFAPVGTAMQNPGAGSYDFLTFFRSARDLDGDGVENGLDTCPYTVNLDASPRTTGGPAPAPPTSLMISIPGGSAGPPPVPSGLPVPSTQDPDGWIDLAAIGAVPPFVYPGSNPAVPAFSPPGFFPFAIPSDANAPEGIDSSCDADPTSPCGPGPFDDLNFAAAGGLDCDLDTLMNRTDNCPQVANTSQTDTDGTFPGPAPDIGPVTDSIGDACDAAPTVPNGHYHMSAAPQGGSGPICITSPVDTCGPVSGGAPSSFPFPSTGADYLVQSVDIGKHGVKFSQLGGSKNAKPGDVKSYNVDVSNQDANNSQDAKVQLSIAVANGTCPAPTIDGSAVSSAIKTVTLAPDGSASVSFSVAYGACGDASAGSPDYILTADACHPGDAAPKGFGASACPGTDPHNTDDSNPSNDAPVSKSVEEK